jgi:hypothetical protein
LNPKVQYRVHKFLFWTRWIQLTPSYPLSRRCITLLFSHLCLGLPSGSYFQFFEPKLCMHFSSLPHMIRASVILFSWFNHPNNIWLSAQVMKLLITQCSPASRHFLHTPQHPVLKHPQSMLLLWPTHKWKVVSFGLPRTGMSGIVFPCRYPQSFSIARVEMYFRNEFFASLNPTSFLITSYWKYKSIVEGSNQQYRSYTA